MANTYGRRTSTANKIGGSLVLYVGLAIGVFMLAMIARGIPKTLAERRWTPTPCTIVNSWVARSASQSSSTSSVQVEYRYQWQGVSHLGNTYQDEYFGSNDKTDALVLASRYPVGAQLKCLVNPADPRQAVLTARPLANLWLMLVPLAVIVACLGGLWMTWRTPPATDARSDSPPGRRGQKIAGTILGAVGIALLVFLVIPKFLQYFAAQSWPIVPCVIESGHVGVHSSSKGGPTYSVNILYRYQVNGQQYKSNRYDFVGGSSSGRSSKQQVVDGYLANKHAVCFVDPSDPYYAVLNRGFDWVMLIFLAIPLVLLLISTALLRGWVKSSRRSDWSTARGSMIGARRGTSSTQSPVTAAIFLIIFTCFWDGFIGIALFTMLKGAHHGIMDSLPVLFLIPFVLVGIALIPITIFSILAISNPRLIVTVGTDPLYAGAQATVDWTFSGRTDRLQSLSIDLQGSESIMPRQAARSAGNWMSNFFYSQTVYETTDTATIAAGRAIIKLPPHSMHSFEADSNKLSWGLVFKGAIARWPNVRQEVSLMVLAPPTAGRSVLIPTAFAAPPTPHTSAPLQIAMPGSRDRFAPGETVAVQLAWNLDERPESINARFFWYTTGRGPSDTATVAEHRVDGPTLRDHKTWNLRLPDHPWSFTGKLMALHWAIEMSAAPGGQTERLEIVIAPAGEDIRLVDSAETTSAV